MTLNDHLSCQNGAKSSKHHFLPSFSEHAWSYIICFFFLELNIKRTWLNGLITVATLLGKPFLPDSLCCSGLEQVWNRPFWGHFHMCWSQMMGFFSRFGSCSVNPENLKTIRASLTARSLAVLRWSIASMADAMADVMLSSEVRRFERKDTSLAFQCFLRMTNSHHLRD